MSPANLPIHQNAMIPAATTSAHAAETTTVVIVFVRISYGIPNAAEKMLNAPRPEGRLAVFLVTTLCRTPSAAGDAPNFVRRTTSTRRAALGVLHLARYVRLRPARRSRLQRGCRRLPRPRSHRR